MENKRAVVSISKPGHIYCFGFFLIFLFAWTPEKAYKNNDHHTIKLKEGITGERISSAWKDALRSRMSANRLDSFAKLKRPLTKEEIAWKAVIESKLITWNKYRDSLAIPFRNVVLPDTVFVMLGYLGDDDAFTYKSQTVCLDLTALWRAYGNADLPENDSRINKIFAHEYSHLLHKEWASKANYTPVTFKDEILWECLYEGLGMYRSLNAKWMPVNNSLPSITQIALDDLSKVFVERMITIEQNPELTDTEKERIHANLSRGQVNRKWGAFPVAIWLMLETRGDEKNLTKWIDLGPSAVISLAKKYLSAELNNKFSDAFH